MGITINGVTTTLEPGMLSSMVYPIISMIIFLLIFGFIGSIARSTMKNITRHLPTGASLKEINNIVKSFPKGISWQQLKSDWDIKMDRETGRVTVTKKTAVGKEGDSTLKPTEIQVTQLAQLPGILRKLVNDAGQAKSTRKNVQFKTAQAPTSASSKITSTQTMGPKPVGSPGSYETGKTIKRVLLIIFLIGLFYGVKSFFG